MIPPAFVAAAYVLVATFLVFGSRTDAPSMRPGRFFLAFVCLLWAGFHVAVSVLGSDAFTEPARILRALSRWLHVSSATAMTVLLWGRWYLHRKQVS